MPANDPQRQPSPGRIADPAAFVRANTRLRAVPHAREIRLHLADEALPLWHRTEEELGEIGLPPPFWAFAWAGGQAIARYVLDDPVTVSGLRVLDLGSGSGLAAIAAAKAGATPVVASEIDAFAEAAIRLNAAANRVYVEVMACDLLDRAEAAAPRYDVILVGDLFYERDTAARALAFLQRCAAAGTRVLIGDPGRAYLPRERLKRLAEYRVPVTRELEDSEVKRTAVWTLG
ncbi:MAG TPA: methyltransferase [Xanthobacteraceae bacterium]|nr:methyltransferase [Xanthobacteraceae bacterium]